MYSEREIYSNASQGEVSPGGGFSCGDYYRGKGARISFGGGGSVLKCTFPITLSTMVFY